jgi:hypothetical protein
MLRSDCYRRYITYINNPVEVGIAEKTEDYLYSSAKDHHATKNVDYLIWSFYKTQLDHGLYCKPISGLDIG